MILELAKRMPVLKVGNLLGEHDTRLWRVIHHYVGEARSKEELSDVVEIGLDETSRKISKKFTITNAIATKPKSDGSSNLARIMVIKKLTNFINTFDIETHKIL
jgi:hypothetical protein